MADDDYDPCECVLSHDGIMRRLMNILRNSQQACNDNECFNGNNSLIAPRTQDTNIFFITMMIGWMMLAFFLFMFRPNSLRSQSNTKNSNNRNGDNDSDFNPPEIH